jgi:hypothetical protein
MAESEDDGSQGNVASDSTVFFARGQPVLLASRVATAFGVETREVNQTVARNPAKFSAVHSFELSEEEMAFLTSRGVISKTGRGDSRSAPRVFAKKGWRISVRFASERKSDQHAG